MKRRICMSIFDVGQLPPWCCIIGGNCTKCWYLPCDKDDVPTVGSRDHPWPFSSLIMQSNSMMLIPHLPKGILRMVNEFAGRCRCDLCSEGTAIAVKSAGVWQYWCIDCCVGQLPDMTHLNIHVAEHSSPGLGTSS